MRSVTKFSSPPAGTPSITTFSIWAKAASDAASAAVTACCACFTRSLSCLALGDERGLLVFRRLRDALAVGVLIGPQLFERGDGGAAVAVGRERLVDGVGRLPARFLRALDQLGIFAEKYGIDHQSSLVNAHPAASGA